MKRVFVLFLSVALLLSFPVAKGKVVAATEMEKSQMAQEIKSDIENMGPLAQESLTQLLAINQKLLDFGYWFGTDQFFYITNLDTYRAAIEEYNALEKVPCLFGDTNSDQEINAKDALAVLRASVGKAQFTSFETYLTDLNMDAGVNAKDALMILQFAVHKRDGFPVEETLTNPFVEETNLYTVKSQELYRTTYQSMIDRTQENGYAATSITGAYPGMFCRDASIQIMAHIKEGDYEQARLLLNFITKYHIENGYEYVLHILYPGQYATPSTKQQTDATFFFLHAWYQFATTAPQNAKNKAYIEGSYSKVKQFANYYLDFGDLENDYDLMFNWNFEHTRETSYWQSYDLLTNVYASQALHELAGYFKTSDSANAKKWEAAATRIVNGVHKNLTVEVEGSLMYAELRGVSQNKLGEDPGTEEKFVPGFSWVNLAPMGCDWYAADPEILEHTYQMYLKFGACRYYRKVVMLDACTNFSLKVQNPIYTGNHVIGKGLAWEIMYCTKTGKTQRLKELSFFLENYCDTMYRETWAYSGGGADTGNQEQASWLLIANKTAFPKLNH